MIKTSPSLERWENPVVLAQQGDAQTGGALIHPCHHDIANPIKRGRARWHCRICGDDISLHYVLYQQAIQREGA